MILELDIQKENEFFSKPWFISYSQLNLLLHSPKLWYSKYIKNEGELKDSISLDKGKLIHNLLLNPEDFDKNFIVSPAKLPEGNNKKVVDGIFYKFKEQDLIHSSDSNSLLFLNDYTLEIIEILRIIDLHQSLKTDEQRLAKILTEENINYFEFLKKKEGKTLVDQDTYNYCKEAVKAIKDNPKVYDLLSPDYKDADDVYNEQSLQCNLNKYPFGLKGILDNYSIDWYNEIIYINDLKTTNKTIQEWKENIDFWQYNLQASIYKKLILNKFRFITGQDIKTNWKVKFHFIVIDNYHQVYAFPVSDETFKKWDEELMEKLDIAKEHYERRDFSLPLQYLNNKVVL